MFDFVVDNDETTGHDQEDSFEPMSTNTSVRVENNGDGKVLVQIWDENDSFVKEFKLSSGDHQSEPIKWKYTVSVSIIPSGSGPDSARGVVTFF